MKFIRYDEEPFKTVKLHRLAFTANSVEFSESAAYIALLNF